MIGIFFSIALIAFYCKRNFIATLILSPLLFVFISKLAAAAFISGDSSYFSSESELQIPLNPLALNLYGLSIGLTFFILIKTVDFETINIDCNYKFYDRKVFQFFHKIFSVFLYIFIGVLFFDLFKIKLIPVFECLERFDYLNIYSSISHKFLIKYLPLISFLMGLHYVYLKNTKKFSISYLLPIFLLMVYLFLTSNRFSAFFQLISYLFMPLFTYYFLKKNKVKEVFSKFFLKLVLYLFVLFIFIGLANSYFFIRDQDSKCNFSHKQNIQSQGIPFSHKQNIQSQGIPNQGIPNEDINFYSLDKFSLDKFLRVKDKIIYRSFVQPLDLYFLSFQRVVIDQKPSFREAFAFIFDANKAFEGNKSIRFLMNQNLTNERALFLEKIHNQFGGGYPEILLELFGIWGMWPVIIFIAYLTGFLIRKLIISIRDQYFLCSFFLTYVLYAFITFYVGGMLNFSVAWTFWTKVILMLFALKFEPYLMPKR